MPKPLSILYIQTNGNIGGTEMMNFRSCLALIDRGHHLNVAILDDNEHTPIYDLFNEAGLKPICLNGRHRSWLALRRAIRQILRDSDYDIVHLFGMRVNLLSRHLVKHHSRAALISGQRSGAQSRWHSWLEKLTHRPVHFYLSNSYAGAQWLQNIVGISPQRVKTIHSGLNPTPFQTVDRQVARTQLQLPPDLPVLIHVANLRPVKDQHTLLRAARLLHEEGVAFELWLVGTGPLEASLKQTVAEHGLTGSIHFLGERQDIPFLLKAADIKLLTSRSEGLPGAIMEAMAAGLPVVATAVGGVAELVVDGETGFLVPAGDHQKLASRLQQLITDIPLRHRLGQAGQQRLLSHFQLKDKIDALEATYLALRHEKP